MPALTGNARLSPFYMEDLSAPATPSNRDVIRFPVLQILRTGAMGRILALQSADGRVLQVGDRFQGCLIRQILADSVLIQCGERALEVSAKPPAPTQR